MPETLAALLAEMDEVAERPVTLSDRVKAVLLAAAQVIQTQQEALTLIANGTQFMRPDAVARAALAKVAVPAEAHRCSGCGHRWDGPLKGAELCGDCWRKGQSTILMTRQEPDTLPDVIAPASTAFLLELVERARHYGHDGDYPAIVDFIRSIAFGAGGRGCRAKK